MIGRSGTIEGLPLQLIITMVVLAITIPLMFGGLKSYDRSRLETEINAQIEEFAASAQILLISGPGNSATVDFTAPSGGLNRLDYMMFGDVPGGNFSSVIRYRIAGHQEASVLLRDPNVPMADDSDKTLELMPGEYRLNIRCLSSGTDLNGDGLLPDNFLQLSVSSA